MVTAVLFLSVIGKYGMGLVKWRGQGRSDLPGNYSSEEAETLAGRMGRCPEQMGEPGKVP